MFVIASDRVVCLLGQGTATKVVEAIDTKTETRVAIKIFRDIPKYRDPALREVRVLDELQKHDPLNRQYVACSALFSFLSLSQLPVHLSAC
jgi:serine/threonine protein kinase